jgi:MFS transporter, FHS family, glucose/mannose:H+ symporter
MFSTNQRIKWALYLLFLVFAILLNSVGTVILQAITSFGVTKTQASFLEVSKDLSLALGAFGASAFLCAMGFRRTVLSALFLAGIVCIAMPLFPSFPTATVLFIAIGVAFAPIKVGVYAMVSKVTQNANEHASVITTIDGMFMVGVLISGWLFSAFVNTGNPGDLSWLNVYWVLGGVILLTALIIMTVPLKADATPVILREEIRTIWTLLWQPLLMVFLCSIFLYVLVEQTVGTWLPTFYKQSMHLPNTMAIQIATLFAGSIALGRFVAAPILRRTGWFPVLITCTLATAALIWLTIPMTHGVVPQENMTLFSAPLVVYLFPLIGFFLAPIYPVLNSVVLSALPQEKHPQMVVLCIIFSSFGGSSGSFIAGKIFDHFDGQTAFLMTTIPLALLIVNMALFNRMSNRAMRSQPV